MFVHIKGILFILFLIDNNVTKKYLYCRMVRKLIKINFELLKSNFLKIISNLTLQSFSGNQTQLE